MLTKTLLALSLLTGTVTLNNYSQASEREVTNLNPQQILTQLPTTELETIAQNITVQVRMSEDRGSGILIAKDNDTYTVITNAHVTDRGEIYTIQTSDGMEHEATLVNSTEQNDLAVLEFNSSNQYQIATVGNSDSITEGETVIAAGFPDGEEKLLVTEGAISFITEKPLNKGYAIGFSNETVQGMSGGALLNSNGEVIAILGKGKDAILDTAYDYMDGTTPTDDEIATFREVSFSIPIANIANLSPQLAALVPGSNPDIAQQPETESTPAPKPEYTGIVKTVDDIAEQITVRIATAEISSYGSGVMIAKDGNTYYVATAGHVVDENGSYQIVTPDGATHELDNQTIEESDAYDFAIFSFTSDKDYTVATIGNYTVGANDNQVVFVSGFPKDRSFQRIITGGVVREQDETSFLTKDSYSLEDNGRGLLYSNLSYRGMSGGAVLDSEGRLVGINTGAENELYSEGDNEEFSLGFSLGVPILDLLNFLEGETPLNKEWLQITNNPVAELYDSDWESIQAQLLTVEQPNDNTDLVAWMNYGNQLWRYGRHNEAVDAFEKVIAIDPQFDRAYYTMGLAYGYQRDYPQAVTALEKATQINPNPYFYWRYLGLSYFSLNQFDEAISAYEQAITNNPEDFVLYVEQGNTYQKAERYEEAITSYNKAVSLNPNHPWIYISRGSLYYQQGEVELALSDYNKAIQLNPDYAVTYSNRGNLYSQQGEVELALSDYNQAIQLNPELAEAYTNRGGLYKEQGEVELALSDYNQAIQLNPELALTYSNRGGLYKEQGEAKLALDDYNQAIQLNPELAEAYANRGLLYLEQGEAELALDDYNQAIQLNPELAEAYNNRGHLYQEQGEAELAFSDYNQAIQLNPDYADAYYNRGVLYQEQGEVELALDDYNRAIQLNPDYADAYINRGVLYKEQGEVELALDDYNQAIQLNPNFAEAYANLGLVYIQLGSIEEARTNLEKAQQLFIAQNRTADAEKAASLLEQLPSSSNQEQADQIDTNDANAYISRGILYYQQGETELALSDYNKAIQLNPNLALAYINRGNLYDQQGEVELALSDYNQAIQLNPNFAEAYYNRGLLYAQQEEVELAFSDFNQAIQLDPNLALAYANLGLLYGQLESIEEARTNLEKARQLFIAQNNTAGAETVSSLLEQLP